MNLQSAYIVSVCYALTLFAQSQEWGSDHSCTCLQGQKPGDYVLFKVEIDCIAVMSACPHDIAPYINGKGGPRDVNYQVFEAK